MAAPRIVRNLLARNPPAGFSLAAISPAAISIPRKTFAGILLLAVAAISVPGCSRDPANTPAAGETPASGSPGATERQVGPVTVEIVRDGQTRTVTLDSIRHGTTVEEVMRSIDEFPVEIRGSGTTAFVDSIDGVATGSETGWTYQIDGESVHEGVGGKRLAPPATIRWSFGGWEDLPEE